MSIHGAPCVLLALAVLSSALARAEEPSGADAARQRIIGSLATSCRQFRREDQWAELDACNTAWFKAHEEEVWRLNLNPHAPHAPGPSS